MTKPPKFDPAHPPTPLTTDKVGSFPHTTLTRRKPKMLQDVLADHAGRFPAEIVDRVQRLHDELVHNEPLRPLETEAPDAGHWQRAWQAQRGRGWLEIPWYFAEAFLYRRLVEATGFFSDGAWGGVDPFLPRKQEELGGEAAWIVLQSALQQSTENTAHSLQDLLYYGVWGNRLDLSYTQVARSADKGITIEQERENLLVDDSQAVLEYLQQNGKQQTEGTASNTPRHQIHFICDNAGTELLTDLALVDFLLRHRWAVQVTLHVKAHPTFVSDTIPADVDLTMAHMRQPKRNEFEGLAGRLARYRRQHRLRVLADFFWNSSHFFWQLPPPLTTELQQAHLVIIKGDANYRRLLGDSRWPTTVPLAQAVPYFPAPFVTLRTLKSEPIVGLAPGQAERLDGQDADWRINGQRGLVQAVL